MSTRTASPFLHPTRKVFYRRVTIPRKIRQHFQGKIEVWRSLKTADQDTAAVRSAKFDAETRSLFVTLKKHGERLSKEQVEVLVNRWLETELDELDDYMATSGPFSDVDRDTKSVVLSDLWAEANEALVSCDFRKVEREADALLKSAGLPPLDHNGAEFGRLCRRLLQTKQEYLKIEADRWEGNYSTGPSSRQAHRVNGSPVVLPAPPAPSSKPASGPLFSVAVKDYLKENPRAVRSLPQVIAEFEKFSQCIGGDRPVSTITKDDGRKYKAYLVDERKVKWATVSKVLSSLSGLFRWAERQGLIEKNPITGLIPEKKVTQKEKSKRIPFTDEQLLTIFGSEDFLAQRAKRPERYWVIVLLLFTGARRDEVAQLRLDDVREEGGIPFLRITDEGPKQSLKNAGSRRRIPLSSSVLKLGFMAYVEEMRKAKEAQLFPQLTQGLNGFGDAVGKYYARLLTKLGLTDKALVLHGLRKSAITKLHEAGVPEKHVQILTGHASSSTVHESYIQRDMVALSVLRDALEKLNYTAVINALMEGSGR